MDALKRAVCRYAEVHADHDGLALTQIEGLRMMLSRKLRGPLHSIYKPLVCLILQGTKRMTIGAEPRLFHAGQSVVVTLDVPVAAHIAEASSEAPYLAVAIEIDMALANDLATELSRPTPAGLGAGSGLFVLDTDAAALDCAMRLMRLLDTPDAIAALRPAIMKELHYWLLAGRHGDAIRQIARPDSHAMRLARAIRILRDDYRQALAFERLAAAASMSQSTFGRRFKAMTSLTPLQFQKQLKLAEARRLMLADGLSSTNAAFAVGYESVSHFTRDYGRLYGAPPLRYARQSKTSAAEHSAARKMKADAR